MNIRISTWFGALILVIALGFPQTPRAATVGPNQFGLGVMGGTIFSITGKYWFTKQGALDFGIGVAGSHGTAIYADYLFHIPKIFGTGTRFGRETSGYFGGGGGIGFWSDSYECGRWHCHRHSDDSGTGVFIRGLVGFEWYPAPTRFGVFGELGPTLLFTPHSGSGIDVGVGGRYYF
ncbi:MAG: hypothetical protein AB7F86_14560 [Bdellovibrionales bacterium]